MKKLVFFFSLFLMSLTQYAQNLNVFSDVNNRLYQFNAGVFEQIYYQQTGDLFVGKKYVCFVDSKGDILVHYNGEQILLGQTYTNIYNTNNLLVMQTANVLRVFDRGIRHILTSNARSFGVGDSLVVFQDYIGGYLKYYYQDEVREIAMVVGDYPIGSNDVGANVFVYKDNAGNASVFWHGKFFPVLSANITPTFACGQDVVAFNDPQTGTFTVFDNGYLIDAAPQHAVRYKAGHNFVYFQDASGMHKVYREERLMDLPYDIQNVVVGDSMITFTDIGFTKVWYNEEVYQIYNETVNAPQIDGGIMAYPNKWGGVSAFVRGKEIEISRQRVEEFRLHGNTIVLKYSRSSYAVWWNGKMYDF